MPRETAPGQYQQENEQRYRQQVDDELLQKHDRRSDLRLGRGKSLVIASESGLEFALALDDDGFITVTNYSTGEVGELTVRFDNVEGLAQEFIDIRAEFAAADGTISTAYIAADAVVAADAASANATLSTTLSAAFAAADATVASNAAALVTAEAGTRASADSALAARASALEATVNTPTTGLTARVTTAEAAIVSGDAANAASISSLSAAVSSIRAQALPTRPAIGADFTSSASGSVTSAADLTAGTVVAVANEGDVRQFTAGASIRHKGYLPVVSGRTYRVRGRVRTTVNGTDNRVQVGFRYLDSSYNSAGFDAGSVDNTFTVADGWLTLEYTRTGAQILAAAGTAAYVTSRVSTGVNAGGTSSGATTQVAWVELEDITDFTTNAAAITTESSARASGDSANATSITNLTAKVRGLTLPDRPSEADDFTGGFTNTTTFAAPALTDGTQATIANEGVVRQFTSSAVASNSLANRSVLQIQTGKTYEVRLRARVTTNATTATNVMAMGFRVFNASGTYLGDHAFTTTENPFNVADGWLEETVTATSAAILSSYPTAAHIRAIGCVNRRLDTGELNNAVTEVAILRLSDITLDASVAVTASAVADIEGRLEASYAIQVDGGGNGALVSLEDGTAGPSSVVLGADEIILDAEAINFGADTIYEDTHNTFYTVGGSYRYRDRGPFGASSDLLVWYGLNSVALNSETKTNGIFAIATDGKTYFGTAPLDEVTAPLEISFSPAAWDSSHTSAGTLIEDVEATVTGGSGTYTYFWSVADVIQGARPTLTNTTTDTVTVTRAYTMLATIEGTISLEVRDTVTGKSARRFWGYLDVYDDGGGGGGSGGALPP
jgi:hypothetical protein